MYEEEKCGNNCTKIWRVVELHSGEICTYYIKLGNISSKNTTLSYEFTISSEMTKHQQYKELHSESHLKPNKLASKLSWRQTLAIKPKDLKEWSD